MDPTVYKAISLIKDHLPKIISNSLSFVTIPPIFSVFIKNHQSKKKKSKAVPICPLNNI